MNELSACSDLEHVDLAAKLQVLRAFLSCPLNLILAFRRPHVQVLVGRERGALRRADDRVGAGLPDLGKCPLTAFAVSGIPDVAVWSEHPPVMPIPFASFTALGEL